MIVIMLVIGIVILLSVYLFSKREFFTNQHGGFYLDTYDIKKGSDMTLGNCLNTENFGWCMNNGFSSRCVPGTKDGPLYDKCDKWYHNDVWTRSVLSADWEKYVEDNIFD